MVYGCSGSASIEYVIVKKTWCLKPEEDGSAGLFIEGVYQGSGYDLLRRVATALGVDPKPTINNMVFFIPNSTYFMDTLCSKLQAESYRSLVTKLGAHVSVARELINPCVDDRCVDDRYTEILFTPELRGRKELPNGNVLYINMKDLGDGVEKAALVALWLEALKPALVLWDDFEASAHPTLIKVLLSWLCKKRLASSLIHS